MNFMPLQTLALDRRQFQSRLLSSEKYRSAARYAAFMRRLGVQSTDKLIVFLEQLQAGVAQHQDVWDTFCRLLTPAQQRLVMQQLVARAGLNKTAQAFLDFLIQMKDVHVLANLYLAWQHSQQESVFLDTAYIVREGARETLVEQLKHSDAESSVACKDRRDIRVHIGHKSALQAGEVLYWGRYRIDNSLKTALEKFKRQILEAGCARTYD